MVRAKNGDTVRVHYTGKLEDGTIFDTSAGRDPLEFTLGERSLIRGFELAVVGMGVGESKTVEIAQDQAYGPHREDRVFEVQRGVLPPDVEPAVGQRFEYRQKDGTPLPLTVTDVSGTTVTLDSNHPLAGKDLTFDLKLVEIVGEDS